MSQSAVNKVAAMNVLPSGAVSTQGAAQSKIGLTGTVLVKTGPGLYGSIAISVAAAGTIAIYDAPNANPENLTPANLIVTHPITTATTALAITAQGFPVTRGLVTVASAGITYGVSFN